MARGQGRSKAKVTKGGSSRKAKGKVSADPGQDQLDQAILEAEEYIDGKRVTYQIGDIYEVGGIPAKVGYINAGQAWLFPLEDEEVTPGKNLLRCVSFEVLDAYGQAKSGAVVKKLLDAV